MHQILKAMMTKEEVAQVIAYCDENKISYKQRLSELGISPWNFYDAKRKYAPKEESDNAGEFLQLIPGGAFLPNPIKPSRSRSSKQKESAQEPVAVNIELSTYSGRYAFSIPVIPVHFLVSKGASLRIYFNYSIIYE